MTRSNAWPPLPASHPVVATGPLVCPVCGSEMFRVEGPGFAYWQCRGLIDDAEHRVQVVS